MVHWKPLKNKYLEKDLGTIMEILLISFTEFRLMLSRNPTYDGAQNVKRQIAPCTWNALNKHHYR